MIPTYNEAENIEVVLTRVRAAVPEAAVLVVDDNSPDGTAELAEECGSRVGQVEVLRRPGKAGLGAAYRAGFAHGIDAGHLALVEMDADLSHNPDDLGRLLAQLVDGADLAIGSRWIPGGATPEWPMRRRLLSKWANRYAGVALGIPVKDMTAGYRAYRADILGDVGFESTHADGYAFQVEMTYATHRAGGRIVEVPISFSDRERGTSKMSGRIVAEAMLLVTWWGFRDRVLRRRPRPPRPSR